MSITPISSIPTFASPEEHAVIVGSTPASFADIPPVLKHTQPDVRIVLEPPVSGLDDVASGTLYVLTSVLVFWSPAASRGFQIPYPSITLHAISRAGPAPAIYCQLEAGPAADADPEDQDADTDLQELSIIPKDPSALDQIFESLSLCAALHPDPSSPDDFDNDNDDAIIDPLNSPFDTFSGTDAEELSEVGRVRTSASDDAALDYMESIIYDPFDHEEEEEEEPPVSDEEDEGELDDADEDHDGEKKETAAKIATST
ncbi:hypothetical protein C0991_004059 [Blastosporella zonata]|nr:hypothetical protein C0991_004059 [Blastosporella zonata]